MLAKAGLLQPWPATPTTKGTGFVQPVDPHAHWHTDISSLNIGGTFSYLGSVLDGCSRANRHWEIRESMTEREVELVLQKAKEKYPEAKPRVISDNGPQFVARDFKQFGPAGPRRRHPVISGIGTGSEDTLRFAEMATGMSVLLRTA